MRILSIFIIFSFISIAVLGVLAMNHRSDGHLNCIIVALAKSQGVSCPNEANTLSLVDFHFNTFKSFSIALVVDSLASIFAFLAVLSISAILAVRLTAINQFAGVRIWDYFSEPKLSTRKLLCWLSLSENSPNLI